VSTIELSPAPIAVPVPPRPEAVGDAELLAAARDHEEWAWTALVERYDGLVAAITRSYRLGSADGAEVRQMVWMRLLKGMSRIRQTDCIAGWVRRVARNECLRQLQKLGQEIASADQAVFEGASYDDLDRSALATECQVAVRQAVAGLPGRGRRLLEALLDDPDLTYEELAIKLDMPVGSIGPTRQRCFSRLRGVPELAALV
jgi:RNA polymerase sigma factor (sigma-70 family)